MNKLDEIKKRYKKLKEYIKNVSIGQYDDKGVNIGFKKADVVIEEFITEVYSTGVKEGGEKMLSEVLKVIPEEKEEEYLMIDGKVIKDGNYANSVFNQCRIQCIERIEELKK